MKSMEITAVGIDVSKRKSTVAIRRPGGVIVACPFDISHSSHDLEKLVSILKTTGVDAHPYNGTHKQLLEAHL